MSKAKADKPTYEPVDASPVKSFFVSMLTRDIKLEEAILDLLDNCVDGVLRTKSRHGPRDKPYKGFWASIEFSEHAFAITDNCGGIPWRLHDYAFRMGRDSERPKDTAGTVGVYGIGMKRAIFKMGRKCRISTQNAKTAYQVEITPSWILDEKSWKLPVKPARRPMKEDGTTLVIENLYDGIAARFSDDAKSFHSDLERMIAAHYAFIINKGFIVRINDRVVTPRPTELVFTAKPTRGPAIRPFLFQSSVDGVDVFLAVGFTRSIPSESEVQDDQEDKRRSSLHAGWTVVCNDRAVLYCDRSELTGWGEGGVPHYHTQFTAISGIVEFRADDASKLPTTTTKRGIDASSRLYLQVKNKMREGMQIFTDYTNKWKGHSDEAKKHMVGVSSLSLEQLKVKARTIGMRQTLRSVLPGRQYRPKLPMPKTLEPRMRRVSYTKGVDEVREVAEYLFHDQDKEPSLVGERCFDLKLREARK